MTDARILREFTEREAAFLSRGDDNATRKAIEFTAMILQVPEADVRRVVADSVGRMI